MGGKNAYAKKENTTLQKGRHGVLSTRKSVCVCLAYKPKSISIATKVTLYFVQHDGSKAS